MALEKYRQKRSFEETPEPTGGKGTKSKLVFVVQQHAASHLHYDFRLEMEGVLKSWAVPKGPSMNPEIKHLAMMVEDHPYDYKDFEGVIPKGNYGAGTVIVWDQGTYEPLTPAKTKKEAEKILLKQLHAGNLKFSLQGRKLKGEFALVKTQGRGENGWLLIKHRDPHASEKDITLKNKSVISGKTLETMSKKPDQIYGKTKSPKAKTGKSLSPDLSDTPKALLPVSVRPMLATLVDKAKEGDEWEYEIKWDGYRTIAICNKHTVELLSRNNKTFNEKFYPIREALAALNYQAVLDGEIAVIKEDGVSHFGALQNWKNETDGTLVYYVFDLLWLNGHDLKSLPLWKRRALLMDLLPEESIIRESKSFDASAAEFLSVAKKLGMEGIIAKRKDSAYAEGDRGSDWLKIKINKRHEVVIGGYTQNEDSRKSFSSLLVGVFENGKLHYTGKIGTGFSDALQKDLMTKFKTRVIKKSPFDFDVDVNKPSRFRPNPPHAIATWLKPELVCEVSYAEITEDGVMRHPSFEGMRDDKEAKEVRAEVAKPVKEVVNQTKKGKIKKTELLNNQEETQNPDIGGHELTFKHLSKIYWPAEGYTKRQLLNYYDAVTPFILPYLKDRPQSLNRFPNGINGKSFYHKDVTATAPSWVKQFPYQTNGEDKNFLVVEDKASILWMANLGAIEMNPWNSRVQTPDHPDWCIIDLDPTEKNTFEQVIQTAQVTKTVLDELRVPSYPKTSGSTGIHIYIPLEAKYSYSECQMFAEIIATEVHHRLPEITSIERMTVKRKGKIYVDFLQNRPKATLAAPYAVRPKPGATVSMPLHWEEVKKGLKMTQFTMINALPQINARGDLFAPVLGKGIDIEKVLKSM